MSEYRPPVQAVLLIGIQATGKSTFYKARLADTHLRVNLDMLKTRHREARLLEVCYSTGLAFAVDNTNATRDERRRYIDPARQAGMSVVGYYFESAIDAALERNAKRVGPARVPDAGLRGTHARLELPERDEGFDELHYVRLTDDGFAIQEWRA